MQFDVTELSREKTLLAIRVAARQIPTSRFNVGCVALVAILASLYATVTKTPTSTLAEWVREMAEMGFDFTIGILGFLIAGFTVFATITKEELFRDMATIRHPTGLSTLKYNLFSFMRVFFDFLVFCSYCLAIKIAAPPAGPLSELVEAMPDSDGTKSYLARLGYAITVTFMIYVLIILKSFVYNIYGFVIATIQWSFLRHPPDAGPTAMLSE